MESWPRRAPHDMLSAVLTDSSAGRRVTLEGEAFNGGVGSRATVRQPCLKYTLPISILILKKLNNIIIYAFNSNDIYPIHYILHCSSKLYQ